MRLNPILTATVLVSAVFATSLFGGPAQAAGPGVEGRVFEMSEEGRIKGVIPNATVEFLDESRQTAASTKSNDRGFFRVDLVTGRYYFRASAEGFRTEDAGRGIVLSLSEGYVVQHIGLVRGETPEDAAKPETVSEPVGLLSGRVLEDAPDGKLKLLPGARITLRRKGEVKTRVVFTRKKGAEDRPAGTFQVRLPAGQWRAAVEARGFARLVAPKPFEIKAGETLQRTFSLKRLVPKLPAGQGLRGDVLLDGSASAGASPPKIQMFVRGLKTSGPFPRRLVLDAPGKFEQDLPEGVYRLAARAEGYHPASTHALLVHKGSYTRVKLNLKPIKPKETTPTPIAEKPVPEKPEEPMAPAGLTVTVLGSPADGVPKPLSGATVLVRPEGGSIQRVTTNAAGLAPMKLGVLDEPVWATILARKEGFVPDGARHELQPGTDNQFTIVLRMPVPNPIPDPVPETETETAQDTPHLGKPPRKPPKGTLSGYVIYRDENNKPFGVRNTRVTFERADRPEGEFGSQTYQRMDTNGDGRVTLDEVGQRYPGLDQRLARLDQNGDGILTRTEIESGLTAVRNRGQGQGPWNVVSGENGRYAVELPVGRFKATTHPPDGYRGLEQWVEIKPGATSHYLYVVRVVPPQPTLFDLTVRVTEVMSQMGTSTGFARLQPAAGATVRVVSATDGSAQAERARADGVVSFKLARGQYRVEASKTGFLAANETAVLDSGRADVSLTLRQERTPGPRPAPVEVRVLVDYGGEFGAGPLAGATVTLTRSGRTVAQGTTAADGYYRTNLAPKTSYQLHVAADPKRRLDPVTKSFPLGTSYKTEVVLRPHTSPRPGGSGTTPAGGSPTRRAKAQIEIRAMVDYGGEFGAGPLGLATVTISQGGKTVAQGITGLDGVYRTTLEQKVAYRLHVAAASIARLNPVTEDFTPGPSFKKTVTLRRHTSPRPGGAGTTPAGGRPTRPAKAQIEIRAMVDYGGEFGAGPLGLATVTISRGGKTVAQGITGLDGVYRTTLEQKVAYQLRVAAASIARLKPVTQNFTPGPSFKTTVTLRSTRSSGRPSGSGTPATGHSRPKPPPPVKAVPAEVRVMLNFGGEFAADTPLAGATVSISRGGKTLARGVTGKDGVYRLSLTPGSGYQLSVTADPKLRLKSDSRTFTVGRSYKTTVTLRPK